MSIRLPEPDSLYRTPNRQNGITDPIWPTAFPTSLDADKKRAYREEYAGRVARQKDQTILRANILTEGQAPLINILKLITKFITEEALEEPSHSHAPVLEDIPDTYRVTITLGLGSTLFDAADGRDRFGVAHQIPRYLKPMPHFPGHHIDFDPKARASDIIFNVSSDHPYVNVAVVRFFTDYFNQRYRESFAPDTTADVLAFFGVETGYARKDKREYLKFDDGIDNINMSSDDLQRLVYVEETDHEPNWCTNGSYMVYLKIKERLTEWESMDERDQEAAIGREKESGCPLSMQKTGPTSMVPVYPDPTSDQDGPLDAHIRKVQPRRPGVDLFGMQDLERRFLRRPYPFFDGLDDKGNAICGLQFIAFMKSLQHQFEHVTNMWQMNKNFPVTNTGIDKLYSSGVLKNVDGGYYFCPPGLKSPEDFLGSGMFE
ncbi:MAG: Dyp-type peroxidase [Pseudomonadota bacterium]